MEHMKTNNVVRVYLLLFSWLISISAQSQDVETPPTLQAADLAPKDVPLKGQYYMVEPEVSSDGLLVAYTIRSDFGKIEARGPGMLRMRVAEVDAVARLNEMDKLDIFVDSLGKSASAVGGAVANVVTNTTEVVKAIPAGVGRFFERTSRQVKTAAQKLGDVRQDKEAGAPRGVEAGSTTQNVALAAGVAAGTATRDVLGYDEKRRELARELGVDPYTTNPVLKKELDDVAWAAFAGGLGINILTAKVPGGRLVQSTSTLSDWIYEKPPGDLKVWIEKSLQEIEVDQETIDLFLRQKYWTLTTQTMLVMALEKLKGVDGRAEVLNTAVTAENEDQTRFLAVGFSLLAREHESTPIKEVVEGKPIGVTSKGHVVATMPVDYVIWSDRVAHFAHREDLLPNKPTVMITGQFSPRARSEFEKAGWNIRENIPVAGVF
jgi:hypothetical protein